MVNLRKSCLLVAAAALLPMAYGLAAGHPAVWQPAAVATAICLAIGLGGTTALRGYQFTAWIVAAVAVGMIHPGLFAGLVPGTPQRPGNSWLVPLIVQLVMFGVGTQMSLRDFAGVMKMPWAVFVGVVSQFTIMPLVGFTLTRIFPLPQEIAAGVILIGACSSGIASNVMVYLARANLALSITLTAITTLLAPIMTPFWMKLLATQLVAGLQFSKMMLDILQLVIVPIGAALLHDFLKRAPQHTRRIVYAAAAVGAAWFAWRIAAPLDRLPSAAQTFAIPMTIMSLIAAAVVGGVAYHFLATAVPRLERSMPLASMACIVAYIAISTAAGRDHLLQVGGLLFLTAVLHNSFGYVLGYGMSRALRLDRQSARTVAFEVGLQNGGMAVGLAGKMGYLATLGLAAIVFSPWMSISGSILANYWHRHPIPNDTP